ncbi:FkbM family methyltransferase, partial [Magnetococcales bacterium HHB-1]
MGFTRICEHPRMTIYLTQERKIWQHHPLRVLDVGARYGGEAHWQHLGDQFQLIGFEADAEEAQRLNAINPEQGHHYYPVALHKDQQERPFYITRFDASCGFYPYRTEVWKRFLDYQNTEIIDQIMLTTQGLDQFYQEQKIAPADFIKLDVEGAE